MTRVSRLTAVAGIAALAVTGLAACSSSSSSSSASSPAASSAAASGSPAAAGSSSPSAVGGMTECTKDKLSAPALQAAQAMGKTNTYSIDTLDCANGWAVTSGTLGNGSTAANSPQGAPTTFVFQAEGQFWVLQDKTKVCGTNGSTSSTPPADATIPAALFKVGCLT